MDSREIFDENTINSLPKNKKEVMDRWRLILGKRAEDHDINFSQENDIDKDEQLDDNRQDDEDNSSKRDKNDGEGKGKEEQQKEDDENGVGNGSGSDAKGGGPGKRPPGKAMHGKKPSGSKQRGFGNQISGIGQSGVGKDRLQKIDDTLDFVYGQQVDQKRSAGLGPSNLSIPNWIENVKELFPTDTKEVLEKDLIERADLKDIIANPELFEKVEPSLEMVKTIIALKHMLPDKVKEVARSLVRKVVEDLRDKFKDDVEKHIIGAIKRDQHTPIKVFRNIDWKESIRKNLKNYDSKSKKLIMAEPRFYCAEKKKRPWQIVVLIDESGSMTDSIVYSVVLASIFASLPTVHTNLVIFDTQVVDLSDRIDDPVEVLMTVQLGGGTNIAKAVKYAQTLIKNPKKTIMVIISDFYEGGGYNRLTDTLKKVLEGQTRILGIAALGYNNEPMYDRNYAKFMNTLGIDVLACTPKNLPEIIAKLMQ
jgi:phage terminase small subunit